MSDSEADRETADPLHFDDGEPELITPADLAGESVRFLSERVDSCTCVRCCSGGDSGGCKLPLVYET